MTPGAAKELNRIAKEYQQLVVKEARSKGPVTPQSIRAADRRLRGVRGAHRFLTAVSAETWDAAAALGALGDGADALFGGAHPLATGTLTGFAVSSAVAAAGIVGKWFSSDRRARRNHE
jgi:hypothetical protein